MKDVTWIQKQKISQAWCNVRKRVIKKNDIYNKENNDTFKVIWHSRQIIIQQNCRVLRTIYHFVRYPSIIRIKLTVSKP